MMTSLQIPPRSNLPYFVGSEWNAATYGSERNHTDGESLIRPQFVRDSFHSLSTGLSTVALWYRKA